MTPILYEKDEIDFTSQGLGSLVEIYDVDVAEQRNGLLQLTASYPVTGVRYGDISVGRIILAKPNQRDEPHAFRITSTDLDIMGHNVMIEADSITYDLNHNIVKHVSVNGQSGQAMMTALQMAVVNPSIFTFYSDITHVSSTSLDYVNPMEAVMGVKGSFLQIWGGELKRENRRVAMFNRRGRDNVATFRLGKNISGLKYKVDISSLVTRILPIKTVQENDATTYLEGTPVSSQYINSYEQIYTIKVDFTDDTIKTVDDLNKASANWFVDSANTARDKPSVTIDIDVLSLQDSADYQDKFKDLESVALTDTVTVYVPEYGINVTAIVNELHFDPIQERVTKLTVGTAKQSFADSSRTQLSDLQDKIISVQNQADATAVSANGKSTNYYGSVEPSHPREGDTWFWVNGDKSGIKVFVNGNWFEPVDSDTQEKIAAGVTDAVTQANAHTDEVKRGLVSDIETAKSQAASQASTAEANAKSAATSQFTQAQNALSAAKTDLTNSIASEASARNQAVSDLDTKAQGYADTAKDDAISAATTADGFINKKIDDTASSITSTISQNKTDADGKIATAQSTATQALNELATKVSQTVYDAKTGQLQADLNTTTTTANTAKTDIVAIKSDNTKQDARMTTIESDADGTKTTVSNLQTDLGKANGSISTLQQRADGFDATVTKVDSLGQINQLMNTEFSPDFAGWYDRGLYGKDTVANLGTPVNGSNVFMKVDGSPTRLQSAPIAVIPGTKISYSIQKLASSGMWSYINNVDVNGNIVNAPGTSSPEFGAKNSIGYTKVENITIPSGIEYISFGLYLAGVPNGNIFSQPMLVFSDHVGTYVQGNYNNNSAIAKAQLTADNAALAISDYKTNADGRISQAQADITATAKQVATKVSQTDYDKKTGDLTTAVAKAQTTADGVVTTVGNYQTSNDKRVKAAESAISQNADTIALKVAKTDYDNNNSQLNTRFTKVETTANGTATTVSDLQQTVNNLGQVNQLFNTEFSPDFAGWYSGPLGNSGTFVLGSPLSSNTAYSISTEKYLGSNVLLLSQGSGTLYMHSDLIAVGASVPIVFSMSSYSSSDYNGTNSSQIRINYYDINKNYISQSIFNSGVLSSWSKNTLSVTTPINTAYIAVMFGTTGSLGNTSYSRPMLVFASKVGTYVQGNYNNNAALAQVKVTADNISNFVRDSSGNISSDFQTALSKTSIITGSTLATSIQTQTSSQITSALTDNNGKIISLINQDSSGVQISGKNIVLDGNTTVTGDFYAKGGNFKNLNASNLTVGTLNGNQVNITNINANNIVSGAISGANLNINLNTGQVVFQRGRIYDAPGNLDINIDQSYISTASNDTRATLRQGKLILTDPSIFDSNTTPYLSIENMVAGSSFSSGAFIARDYATVTNYSNKGNIYTVPLGTEIFSGLSTGRASNGDWQPTKVAGAERGVVISGGTPTDYGFAGSIMSSPYITVGMTTDNNIKSNKVVIWSSYTHLISSYYRTTSSGANLYIAPDGAVVRSSSSSKYKLDIEYEQQADTANKLLTIDPATWHDKFESKQLDKFHKIGVDPEIAIDMSNRRYYGIIAEDLVKAGLEHLVSRNVKTGEVEGVEYSKIGVALIPIIRDLRNRLNDQHVEIERLKEKIK